LQGDEDLEDSGRQLSGAARHEKESHTPFECDTRLNEIYAALEGLDLLDEQLAA
jgi:hypothetical protein